MNRRSFVRRLVAAVCAAPLASKLPALVPVAPTTPALDPHQCLDLAGWASGIPLKVGDVFTIEGHYAINPERRYDDEYTAPFRVGNTVRVRLPQRYRITTTTCEPRA